MVTKITIGHSNGRVKVFILIKANPTSIKELVQMLHNDEIALFPDLIEIILTLILRSVAGSQSRSFITTLAMEVQYLYKISEFHHGFPSQL
jgi:hypothetical protein